MTMPFLALLYPCGLDSGVQLNFMLTTICVLQVVTLPESAEPLGSCPHVGRLQILQLH
jgi:hypothetical protein